MLGATLGVDVVGPVDELVDQRTQPWHRRASPCSAWPAGCDCRSASGSRGPADTRPPASTASDASGDRRGRRRRRRGRMRAPPTAGSRSGHLDVARQLTQHLHRRGRGVVDRFRHPQGQPVGELQLRECPDGGLLHDVGPPRGRPHHRVVDVDVAVDEHALVRHLDIVEDGEGVLLVEPR